MDLSVPVVIRDAPTSSAARQDSPGARRLRGTPWSQQAPACCREAKPLSLHQREYTTLTAGVDTRHTRGVHVCASNLGEPKHRRRPPLGSPNAFGAV